MGTALPRVLWQLGNRENGFLAPSVRRYSSEWYDSSTQQQKSAVRLRIFTMQASFQRPEGPESQGLQSCFAARSYRQKGNSPGTRPFVCEVVDQVIRCAIKRGCQTCPIPNLCRRQPSCISIWRPNRLVIFQKLKQSASMAAASSRRPKLAGICARAKEEERFTKLLHDPEIQPLAKWILSHRRGPPLV